MSESFPLSLPSSSSLLLLSHSLHIRNDEDERMGPVRGQTSEREREDRKTDASSLAGPNQPF